MNELSTDELLDMPLPGDETKIEETAEAVEPKEEVKVEETAEEVEETAETETEEVLDKPKKVSGHKRRIDRKNRQISDLEAKLRQYEQPAPVKQESNGEPNADDYDEGINDLGYIKDVAKNEGRKAYQEAKQADLQEAEQTKINRTAQETESNYESKIDEAHDKYEDFEEVFNNTRVDLDPAVLQAVKGSEHAGDLTYSILKDKALAEKLSNMTPIQGIMEIGRMETKLSKPDQGKKASKMSKPFKPVGTGKTNNKPSYSEDMNSSQYDEAFPFEDLEKF